MTTFRLRIEPGETALSWKGLWFQDDRQVGDRFTVEGTAAKVLAETARRFLVLFEHDPLLGPPLRPLLEPDALAAMGRVLFATWFQPAWAALESDMTKQGPRRLLIQTQGQDVLNLPWELVEVEPGRTIGCDAAWSLFRYPVDTASAVGAERGGPLRILFLSSAPVDQDQLDYEREEDAMLRATSRLQDVSVHIAEAGTFEALQDLVAACRPHVVHISGHGIVKEGMGHFAFEDERGRTDLIGVDRIVADVVRGDDQGVRAIFFNGCQTSQAATSGLCQSLVKAGLPLAVGWAASVADDRATDFAEEFYTGLASGQALAVAAAHAREAIRRKGEIGQGDGKRQDATFALPQVYTSAADARLYDPKGKREDPTGPQTIYNTLGENIQGLREGFIGRRREQQRLVPALRQGETTFAVLTGLGGTGKSTLATRVANRLETHGFRVVPLHAEEHVRGPAESGRLFLQRFIEGIGDEVADGGRQNLAGQLSDEKLTPDRRARLVLRALQELRLVVVVDDFEHVLDLEERRIVDPDLAALYKTLATGLVRGSRVILTCRYLPQETPTSQSTVLHLPLVEFTEANVLKFLRRDPAVYARMARGELSKPLIEALYKTFGGTPRFLHELRALLATAEPDELRDDLDGTAPGRLSEARDEYFGWLVAGRLFKALPPAARLVANRLAVSELPLPIDAVADVAQASEEDASRGLEACVAFGLLQRSDEVGHPPLYHTPGLLRPWLSNTERLPEADAGEVHRRLAAFWRSSYESDREAELRVTIEAELAACRFHAQWGGEQATFRWATVLLARLLQRRAEWSAARALLGEIADEVHDAESLRAFASLEDSLGEWKSARKLLERATQMASGDRAGEAATWHNLATVDVNEGDYAAAREKFGRSLAMLQAIGDRAGEAATWHQLATVDLNEGDYASAREKFGRSLAIKQAIGDRAGEAATWHQLATVDVREGDYAAAREKLGRSLAMLQAIGDRADEAATWHNLASVDLNEGDYAAAREKFGRSLAIKGAIGDRAGEATTWHQLATLDIRELDYQAAREKFGRALEMRREIGDRQGEAATWHQLATLDVREGDYAAAREKLGRSLAMLQAIGDRVGEAATWHNLASVDLNEGDYAAAREKFGRSLAIKQAIGDRAGEATTWHQLGALAHKLGQGEQAARCMTITWLIDQAIGHADAEGDFQNLAMVCESLGYSQARLGALVEEMIKEYQADRGRAMVAKLFADA